MDDPPLQKIAISGPTLASLIQRFSTSPSSLNGLLFGHVTHLTPLTLSDDTTAAATTTTATTTSDSSSSTLLATVTGFLSSPSPAATFYDSTGAVSPSSLRRLINPNNHRLLGWFSARRKTPLRPSMREFSVTTSLSCLSSAFNSPIENSPNPRNFSPCVFILLSSPFNDNNNNNNSVHIHTHEYRAYQLRAGSFEAKPIDVVNIGPAFRGHYGSFSPNAPFPALECDFEGSNMKEDGGGGGGGGDDDDGEGEERLSEMKQRAKDQREVDGCAEGFEVGRLSRMMGSEARSYTAGLEDLYVKMLAKVENLTRLVEENSAKVLEQESYNRKLKQKILRSAASE